MSAVTRQYSSAREANEIPSMGPDLTHDTVSLPASGAVILDGDLIADGQGVQVSRLSVVEVVCPLLLLR